MREDLGVHDDDPAADHALMARVGLGDEEAFLTVYDRYASRIYGASVRLLRDPELAAEVVQDTFLATWSRAAQFDPAAGSLIGWLLAIARHRAIDRLRAEKRRGTGVGKSSTASGADDRRDGIAHILALPAPEIDEPGAQFEQRWLRAVVRTVLAELSFNERRVLVLAYDDGLSQSEIADRLGLPVGTVKSRTRRGLASLRASLEGVPGLRAEPPTLLATDLGTPAVGGYS
ncbi:MAG: sigma-70 family RNA polymerase sigma factor [Chloroflexota bacterium]